MMNWVLLQNSLLVGGLATLTAAALGLVAALYLSALETRRQRVLLAAAAVTLALPPFLVTSCWLHYLGHTGVWRDWLPLNIYSLTGTVWILTLMTWPITMFLVLGAWQRLEPSQLESDPALQGFALVKSLLLPLARPALGLAAVLGFVLALNNFAVPAILQTKVFPAELWVGFNTTFDYTAALKISWPLILAPLLLLVWLSRRGFSWPALEGRVSSRLFRRQLGRPWLWTSGAVTIATVVLAMGLPLIQLIGTGKTWLELSPALAAGRQAFWNSFAFAAMTATLCAALGLATWRWRAGLALWLIFLTPGVLLGIVLIFLLNRPVLDAVYQSAGVVVAGFTLRYLAIIWDGARRAMRSLDRDLTAAARLLGATGWPLLRHVHWPQIAPQIAAVWYVTYLLCLWDVETLVLIVPPGGETLALRVFNLLHYGHNDHVNALCVWLLVLAVAPLVIWGLGQWLAGKRNAIASVVSSASTMPVLIMITVHAPLNLAPTLLN